MRLGADDITADRDPGEPAGASPVFHFFYQAPAEAAATMIGGHDQTHNLTKAVCYQNVLFPSLDPTNHKIVRCVRDEDEMLRMGEQSREPARHHICFHRVTEDGAELREPRRVLRRGLSDRGSSLACKRVDLLIFHCFRKLS